MTTSISWDEYNAKCEATDARYSDIPLPEGATIGSHWSPPDKRHRLYWRFLTWGDIWGPDHNTVAGIIGEQFSDGRLERRISVDFDDVHGNEQIVEINSATARQLAALLLQVADKFDGWVPQ